MFPDRAKAVQFSKPYVANIIMLLAPKRGESGSHSDTRTVTQLLSLMDGLKRVDAVIVIGTTNRIDAIVVRFNGHFRALAGLTHGRLNDDRAVVYFRHFHLK